MPQQIDVPGHGIIEFPDGMNDAAITAAIQANMPQSRSTMEEGGRQLGLTARAGVSGLAAIPAALANIPAAAYNGGADLIQGTGQGYRFPEQNAALGQALTAMGLPEPENATERVVQGATSAMAGAGASIGLGNALAASAAPIAAGVGDVLSAAPATQIASAGMAGAASAGAKEAGLPVAAQLGAGLAAGLMPAVGGKLLNPISSQLSPEIQRLADLAKQEGISLTPAQQTGSKVLQGIETGFGELPLTAGQQARIADQQASQFNKAALSKAGIQSDVATPQVLAGAADDFEQRYRAMTSGLQVPVDNPMRQSLSDISNANARRLGPEQGRFVQSYIDDLQNAGPTVDGSLLQRARSELSQRARNASSDFEADQARALRNVIDNAIDGAMPAAQRGDWQKLNKQYTNFRTISKAMEGSSQAALNGNIPAAALSTAARRSSGQGYTQGTGDLNDLSRAGSAFLREKSGNSGTANRLLWQSLLTGGAGVAGGTVGGPIGGAVGVGATLAAPRLAQALYNSRLGQQYLTEGFGNISPQASALGTALGARGN